MVEGDVCLLRHPPHYESHRAVIRFTGNVEADKVFALCDEIDFAVGYYHYPTVTIEIDSPGGELKSLRHYIARLRDWRRQGVRIETLALTQCCSAAAYMLSMGDLGHRMAMPRTTLLYHHTRVVGATQPLTSDGLDRLRQDLTLADAELIVELVRHLYGQNLPQKLFECLMELTCTLSHPESAVDLSALAPVILSKRHKTLLARLDRSKRTEERQHAKEELHRQLRAGLRKEVRDLCGIDTVAQLRNRLAETPSEGHDRLTVIWLLARYEHFQQLFAKDELLRPGQAIAAGLIDTIKE